MVLSRVKRNPQQAHRARMETVSRVLVYAWLLVAMFIILFPSVVDPVDVLEG